MHDILRYNHMTRQRTDKLRPMQNAGSNVASKKPFQIMPTFVPTTSVNASATASADTRRPEVRCYNCQATGHFSKDCPEPRRDPYCILSKTKGHLQRQCPHATTVSVVAQQPITSVGKYLKTIRIDDRDIGAFIDTASSVCTIKASTVLSRQLPMMYSLDDLRGFGSGEIRTQSPGYIVASLQVDEAVVSEVPIRVVPDDAQTTEVIVGRTFTEAQNVIYVKQGDTLTFKSNYLGESSIPDTDDSTLQITSDNIIPAMSVQ